MRIEQTQWSAKSGWNPAPPGSLDAPPQLLIVFGGAGVIHERAPLDAVRAAYPRAHLIGCTTAGEICGDRVEDDTIVCTAVHFEQTPVRLAKVNIGDCRDSFDAGERLARALDPGGIAHVFVLSDGQKVNGSELVRGLHRRLPSDCAVTGGLAADGDRFVRTLVFADAEPEEGAIVAVALYGPRIRIGYGSMGGWDPFGPDRLITKSKGNVLYELDGRSALQLYTRYLGEAAAALPGSALHFPLSLRTAHDDHGVVRTILGVNEKDQSMTFAGDMPEGSYARLMKANFDRLVDGATGAARSSCERIGGRSPDLSILISCVGRRLVLKQRVEDEVESVRSILGSGTVMTGFYSYGEISPVLPSSRCELHNQTMTITTFLER